MLSFGELTRGNVLRIVTTNCLVSICISIEILRKHVIQLHTKIMFTNKISNLMYKTESPLEFEAVELSIGLTSLLQLKFV